MDFNEVRDDKEMRDDMVALVPVGQYYRTTLSHKKDHQHF